jgi:diguanylate cyclase
MPSNPRGLDDWKAKYAGLLAELEAKEYAWTTLETALRLAGTQLAIAALGQSEDLDKVVDAVLAELRRPETDPAALGHALQRLKPTVRDVEQGTATMRLLAIDAAADADAKIAALLKRLAVRIAEFPELADAGGELMRAIGNSSTGRNWEAITELLADGIAAAVDVMREQRKALELFLEEVTVQLASFETWATWQQGDAVARADSSETLEQSVQEQMQGLREAFDSTPSITELKFKVQRRLDAVAERLHEFREAERASLAEAARRHAELDAEIGRLRQLADSQRERLLTDALTGVHSRHAYEQRLDEEFHRWQRQPQPFSFAIWDIDEFKSVNDRFGHQAGDRLLQMIGKLFNAGRRREDFIARIGGEEFALLMPGAALEEAKRVVDRVREQIASTPFHHRGKPQQVTVSCGLTEFREGDTAETVYARADAALYRAKSEGRNHCVAI